MAGSYARIERLGRDGADALATLRAVLWPDRSRADFLHEARQLADAVDRAGFLARRPDGTPVGFAEVSLRDHAEGCRTSPVAFLEGWFVHTAHRRRDVGRSLLDAALQWARTQGCREFASDTALGDEPALAAHLATGFHEVARLVCLRRPL